MKKFTIALLFLVSVFAISCEIGLGAAVDTDPPTLDISTPPVDAVIRDKFAIAGNWTDDGTIASVKLKLERTDGLAGAIERTAEVKEVKVGKGTWEYTVDPIADEVIDGTYQSTITIEDNVGRKTVITRTFTVDNTPPVLILTKPNSKDDDETISAYGQRLFLEGSIADSAKETYIKVDFYKDKDCSEENLLDTITTSAISPTDVNSNNAKLAIFKELDYDKIYQTETNPGVKEGSKVVYLKFTVSDLAGNETTDFYFSKELAKDLTKSAVSGGDGLAPIDIYNILNGTDLLSSNARSAETNEDIKRRLAAKAVKTSAKLSINPENSPYFTVSGMKTLTKSGTDFASSDNGYWIINGSQSLEISVFMGSDSIELVDDENFYVYLLECDDNGDPLDDSEDKRIKLYSKSKETGSGANKKTYYSIGGKQTHKTTSGAYVFTVPMSKSLKADPDKEGQEAYVTQNLEYGKNYVIRVSGKDNEDNPVEPNETGYGFHFTSSNGAPVLNITQPTEATVFHKKGEGVLFEGSAKSDEGVPTVTVWNGNVKFADIPLESSVDGELNEFSYTIPAEMFDQDISKIYSLSVKATRGEAETESKFSIWYDVDGPKITLNSISPIVSVDSKENINGNLKIKGTIIEEFDQFGSATLKVLQDGEEVTALTRNLESSFDEIIDTTELTDKKNATIKIIAYDRVGNESTKEAIYYVNQESDRPTITNNESGKDITQGIEAEGLAFVENGNNLYIRGGNLVLSVSDDDSVKKARVIVEGYNKTNGTVTDLNDPKQNIFYESPAVISHTLPNAVGLYRVTVTVYDENYKSDDPQSTEYTPYSFRTIQYFIKVTGTGPDVSITPDKEYIKTGGSYTLTINVTDEGNKPYMLKLGDSPNPEPNYENITDDEFEYILTPSNTNTVKFTIIDKNSSFTEKNFTPKFDDDAPTVAITNWPNNTSLTEDTSYLFKGTMSDTGKSGIDKVEIKFVDGEHTTTSDNNWTDCTAGLINWNSEITWASNNVFNTEGKKTVFVKATDGAGNVAIDYKSFIYDKGKPVLTIPDYLSTSSTNVLYTEVGTSGYTLSGTVTETNGLATDEAIVIKVDNVIVKTLLASEVTGSNGTYNWSYLIPIGSEAGKIQENQNVQIQVIAKDKADKTDTKQFSIYYDTNYPTLEVTAPAENESISDPQKAIKGTVTDEGYGIQKVEFELRKRGTTTIVTSLEGGVNKPVQSFYYPIIVKGEQWFYAGPDGTAISPVSIPLGTDEGALDLYVKATEKQNSNSTGTSGGRITEKTVPFYYDKANPGLEENIIGTTGKTINGGNSKEFTLSGKVWDSNELATLTIKCGDKTWVSGTDTNITITGSTKLENAPDSNNWTATFKVGSDNNSLPNYIVDGTKEFTIIAKDIAGKEKELTRSVIVDTTPPTIGTPEIKETVGATIDGSPWYKTRSLSIEVTAADTNGSGISKVEYTTDNGTTWNQLSPEGTKYTGTVTFASDGKNLKLKVRATDVASNISATTPEVTLNIDTTAPELSVNKEGIFYVQSGESITVYGNYEDSQSGVKDLIFKIGDISITPTVKYSTTAIIGTNIPDNYSSTMPARDAIKSWKAEFVPEVSGKFAVQGENRAGDKTSEIKAFDITIDTEQPAISNVKLEEVKDSNTKEAYQNSSNSKYYVNNQDKTFKISGVSTDETGIESVVLTVTNTATSPETELTPTINGTTGKWNFNFAVNNWNTGAIAKVKVTDKAGRYTEETLNIVFDVTAPATLHKIDDFLKNLEFRIGDSANDAGESDVGGKYSDGTYGSALTMQIRGNFPDDTDGSDIKQFYYKTFNNQEVTIDSSKENASTAGGKIYFKTLNDLKAYVIANKTDVFSPLETAETKNVEYNVGPFVDDNDEPLTSVADTVLTNARIRFGGNPTTPKENGNYTVNDKGYVQFRTSVDSNFKTTIKGFQEGKNFLVIVAEDNAGNTAVDSAVVNGVTYPCYSLNVDITAPKIPTKQEGTKYTNLKETNGVVISGTVSDKPNVVNGSSGLKKIVFTRDGGTGSVELTTFTTPTEDDVTAASAVSSDYSTDTTLKHWEVDVSSLLPENGTAIISAKVIDNAGYETSEPVANLIVDKVGPIVRIVSPSTDTYKGKKFNISGTANDGSGAGIDTTQKFIICYTTDSTVAATEPATTPTTTANASSAWKKLADITPSETWNYDVDFTSLVPDLVHTSVYFRVSATDLSGTGNTAYSDKHTIIVDRKKPVFSSGKVGGKTSTVDWFKDDTLNIEGTFTDDGTKVSYIKYQIGSGTIKSLPSTGSYNTNVTGFATGENTLYIWAVDEAENESVKQEYTVKIDKTAPVFAEENVPFSKVYLTNGDVEKELKFYVTEANSGLKASSPITITIDGNEIDLSGGEGKSSIALGAKDSNGKRLVTLTLAPADLQNINGYKTILATAEDIAGNKSTPESIGILNKDGDAPEPSFISPQENDIVNKLITVEGKIAEANGIDSITLEAVCGSNTIRYSYPDFSDQTPYEFSAETAYAVDDYVIYNGALYKCTKAHTAGEWNKDNFTKQFSFDSASKSIVAIIDTTALDPSFAPSTGNSATLTITAQDEAGNSSTPVELPFTINQHNDRPTITIGSNVNFTKHNGNEIWVKGSSTIYGSVIDDDGIATGGFKIWRKLAGTADTTYVNADASYTGGSWNVKLPKDGSYVLKFDVTDKEGTQFVSKEFSVGENEDPEDKISDEEILLTPLIQDAPEENGVHQLGLAKDDYPDTLVPICLDTESPALVIEAISYDKSTWVEDYNKSDFYLGGKKDSFYVKVSASDTSGLFDTNPISATFSGTMKVGTDEYGLICPPNSCTVENGDATGEYIIKVENFKNSGKISRVTNEEGQEEVTISDTDIRDFSGTLLLTISAKDMAEITTDKQLSKTIDNAVPTIHLTVPSAVASTAVVSGSIEGEIVNPTVSYMLSDSEERPDEESEYWNQDTFASLSYNIYFDGINSDTATHTDLFRTWLTKPPLNKATETEIANNEYTDLTEVYVWIKAEDVCGNTNYAHDKVVVDPQGNRPTVSISYPEADAVLGGTIRVMGTANDNIEAKYAWIQLDIDGSGWGLSDYNILKAIPKSSTDSTPYYTFGQISKNKTLTDAGITPATGNISDIGIMVEVSGGSWNVNINPKNELIPSGSLNNVTMTVYATDNDSGTSVLKSVPVECTFSVDKESPYFVQNSLKLVKDDGSEQVYKEGMSVKGEWWLIGEITDDVGINTISVTIDGEEDEKISSNGQSITTGAYRFNRKSGDNKTYEFKIKVGSETGVGKTEFRLTAVEVKDNNPLPVYKDFLVNYDNEKPTFAPHTDEANFKISKTVENSQGYYSLRSVAYENHDGDTGVERIAVFFTRTIGTTTYVFDPMYKRGFTPAGGSDISKLTTGSGIDLDEEDGLYWGSATASSISSKTLTLSENAASYVHAGGLAKVKGVVYRIDSVSGSTVVLAGEPGDSESDTYVYFAVANVVDNTNPESKKAGSGSNTAYNSTTGFGYGYCNDYVYDDDDMIMENLHKDDSKTWTWELYVNSKNISDGDVDIHYVIFDKAGNSNHDKVERASVENNKPRLVSVVIGLDKNQNGTIDDDEKDIEKYPEGLTERPVLYTNAVSEINISGITVKGKFEVIPEIVGGNGNLYYQWKTKTTTEWQKYGHTEGEGENATFIADSFMTGNNNYDDADFDNSNDYVVNGVLKTNEINEAHKISHEVKWLIDNSTDNDEHFSINYEIFDETDGKTVFTDSNKVSINITDINLQVRDKVDPTVTIDEFYWNSLADNSVYTSKAPAQVKSVADLEGHIELHGDLPTAKFNATAGATDAEFDADDKVSGKIKLKGTVSDNIVLTDLYLLIDGMTGLSTSTKVATYDKTNGKWKNAAGTADFAKVGVLGTNGYEFDIDTDSNEFDIDNGHSVNWTLVWDTATISNVAQNNIKVQVVAYDNASAAGNNSNRSTTATRQVDVVPYITKIDTGLNGAYSSKPSVFNRSANGAYSVRRGESITIWGYNLKKGTTAPTVTIPVTSTTTITPTASSKTSITVAIPNTAKSGEIGVTVNAVQTLNNKTAKSITTGEGDEAVTRIIEYNQEPNGINNDILTDVRKLSVWSFVDIVTDQGVRYPTMRVGKDTNQYVGFIFGSGADKIKMYRNKDLTKNAEFQIGHSWTQYYSTGVAVDNAGRIYGSSQNGDSGVSGQTQGGVGAGNYANNQFFAWNTTEGDIFAYSSGTNGTAIENAYNGSKFNSERIKNQKITVSSGTTATSTGNVYMVYYDDSNSQIKFRYGTVSNNGGNPKFSTALDNHNNNNNGTTPGYQIIAGPESMGANKIDGETDEQDGSANTSRAGEYAAVGVIPSTVATGNGTAGTAVVAWYDASSQRLLFSYNTAPTETNNASKRQWGTNTKVIDPDFAGWYVDMVVDPEGGIHIAYYGASNGDLKYAYLPNYSSAPQICTVDSYLSVGTNISIEVPTAKETVYKADGSTTTRYVPRISYFMSAFTKTKYSVRTAYLYKLGEGDVMANGVSEDKFTGNWEVMTVPTNQIPLDYTIGVGIKKNDSNTNATLLGYGTKTGLQTAALQ